MENKKSIAGIVWAIITVLIIGAGTYIDWVRKPMLIDKTIPVSQTITESTVSEDTAPVIYSVTPTSGPIGTKITIKGKNLNGFEGDLNARIATEFNPADYSSGIMYGERTGSTDTMVTTIESSFCKQDTSYSGLPCTSYFYVTPGVYDISVKPWGKESNSVSFMVTPN